MWFTLIPKRACTVGVNLKIINPFQVKQPYPEYIEKSVLKLSYFEHSYL